MTRAVRWSLLAVFGIGVFLAGLELMITATALPSILLDLAVQDELGKPAFSELRHASWIVNGYLLAYVVAMPLAGRIADVNRLRIVRRLAAAYATVAELVAQVGLSQPLVSWHIGRLRAAGLVTTRRLGRETICRLQPEAFAAFAAREAAVLGLAGADADPERAAS
jgi:DNA-binding transcriptional ArsR family regulator